MKNLECLLVELCNIESKSLAQVMAPKLESIVENNLYDYYNSLTGLHKDIVDSISIYSSKNMNILMNMGNV